MRTDEIDAIESYNDPNSCYQPSDEEAPTRCNHCEYCRLTKKIELPIHASEIEVY